MKSLFFVVLSAGYALAQAPDPITPITGSERLTWVVKSTVGVPSLVSAAFASGFDTLIDTPKEYDTHWQGFAKRYGLRMSGIAAGNVMEAGLGAVIGEDPRYVRAPSETPFSGRVRRIMKWTFVAPGRDGQLHPAYARFVAIAGSSAVQNLWVPDSQSTSPQFLERAGLGIASHVAGNIWAEFWPDARRKLFHK